jgi:hypothetical protein
MDLINTLPGNGTVNTVQHATIDEAVFSMLSAPCNNMVEVFSMWSVPSSNTEVVISVHGLCQEDIRFSLVQES